MVRLHVNVDHVATIRQARRGVFPDPVEWAVRAEDAGAHGITCHLRRDRRHIQDEDLVRLREVVDTLLNLETSLHPEMIAIALDSGADEICIVPENRQEVTTEGGLDVAGERKRLADAIPRFRERGMAVSLFVDPDPAVVTLAADLGAEYVELHTGCYANVINHRAELKRLVDAAKRAHGLGLKVNAGHGLDYRNVSPVAALPHLVELNIGHAIVAQSVLEGVDEAIREMLALVGPRNVRS